MGQRVKERRRQLGLSQERLGDAVGLTFQQIQKYEKGTNRIGSSRLQQFADILTVGIPYFFDGLAEPKKASAKGNGADYIAEFAALPDGRRLMKAYMRIEDRELRRRIARLIERIAG